MRSIAKVEKDVLKIGALLELKVDVSLAVEGLFVLESKSYFVLYVTDGLSSSDGFLLSRVLAFDCALFH